VKNKTPVIYDGGSTLNGWAPPRPGYGLAGWNTGWQFPMC